MNATLPTASPAESPVVNAPHHDAARGAGDAAPAQRWRGIDVLLLVVALAVSFAVQWTHVQKNPSFDELWHLMLSTGRGTPVGYFAANELHEATSRLTSLEGAAPAWHVWTTLDAMPHPPLYFTALRAWREVFGEGDRAGHAFSIACSLVAVGFTFAAGRLAMNGWAAALAALTLGCAQTQVYLAQEMRPYALATAIAAAAVWLMTRVEVLRPTRAIAIALAALTLPLMLSHYFTLGACVGIAIYGLIRLRGHRIAFVATLTIAALAFAIAWLPFALRQARDVGPAGDYLRADHVDLLREIALVACAPFRLIADREYTVERVTLLSGALFVLPWLLARRLRPLAPWGAILCASILPIFLLDVFAARQHLNIIRYCAVAAPAVVLLFVGCAWAIDRRLAYATGATVLAAGVMYLASRTPVVGECPDFTRSIAIIERDAQPGDAILCYPGTAPKFFADMMALTAAHSHTLLPRPMMVLTQPLSPEVAGRLPARAWLVSGNLDVPVSQLIPNARVISMRAADIELTVTLIELPRGGAS